jgi:hypothetical protein
MSIVGRLCASALGILIVTLPINLGTAPAPTPETATGFLAPATDPALPMACCKICTKGKACGNACIARDKECHQPPGCACDG